MAEALGQDDFPVVVATLAEAAAMLAAGTSILVVVASPADALDLIERGAGVTRVNVGGLRGAGKRELTSYVFLSREEAGDLRALLAHGIELEARDLPGASGLRIDAAALEQLWP
jgi:mannose/fructose/N-acetylgalactosamine-specific phosphotransferase system component IIB